MQNTSHVCFRCRRVMRRSAYSAGVVPCSSCGEPAEHIGVRVPVPPRDNLRGWAAFEESWREAREEAAEAREKQRVRSCHDVERRIAELERRGGDEKSRRAEIRRLQQRLERLLEP